MFPTATHSMTVRFFYSLADRSIALAGRIGVGHCVRWMCKRATAFALAADVMKNVRTVQIEELSKEQIEAARLRRRRDRSVQQCNAILLSLSNKNWAFSILSRLLNSMQLVQGRGKPGSGEC
jgi:hypothetical protein